MPTVQTDKVFLQSSWSDARMSAASKLKNEHAHSMDPSALFSSALRELCFEALAQRKDSGHRSLLNILGRP